MSSKAITRSGMKQVNPHKSYSTKKSGHCIDEVPLISSRGYVVSSQATAIRMKKAQESLDEARRRIVLCQ